MAIFTTILLGVAVGSVMVGSVTNAVKADQNKQCNIEGMNKLVDHYKQVNEQFEQDIKSLENVDKVIQNINSLENSQILELQKNLANSQKDYQKHVHTIYMYFGIFIGVVLILSIIKAIIVLVNKGKIKKAYLKFIQK